MSIRQNNFAHFCAEKNHSQHSACCKSPFKDNLLHDQLQLLGRVGLLNHQCSDQEEGSNIGNWPKLSKFWLEKCDFWRAEIRKWKSVELAKTKGTSRKSDVHLCADAYFEARIPWIRWNAISGQRDFFLITLVSIYALIYKINKT